MRKYSVVAVVLLFCINEAVAKPITDSKEKNDSLTSFIALPIMFYGEETNLGFGASAGYYYANKYNKISSILANGIFTLNEQFRATVIPNIYTKNGNYFYSGSLKFNYYPDKFFGIGRNTPDSMEESYTSKSTYLLVQHQRLLFGRLMFGVQYNIAFHKVGDTLANGLIGEGICGSDNFLMSGMGALLTWDNRNNRFWPTSGAFFKISAIVNSEIFGSDLSFSQLTVDLRKYYNVFSENVLALQLYGDFTWNEVPFQLMPKLGGSDILRGYYNGRFRDKMMFCAQAEFRFDIYRWLRGVAFASLGDVASKIGNFDLLKPKYSYGAGLRVRLNDAKVNVRADLAFTGQRIPAIYFTAIEAF